MLLHRKAMHPYSRVNKLGDLGCESTDDHERLLHEAEQNFYAGIVRVGDDRDGQWLAELEDGVRLWVTLPDDNEHVLQYLALKSQIEEANMRFPKIADVHDFNLCPWVPVEI